MDQVQIFEGQLRGEGRKFAIVISRFNSTITGRLLEGALDCLTRHGTLREDISVYYVPGAFEIPLMAQTLAKKEDVDGIICLGAVIRGATDHYDLVCAESSKGIAKVSLDSGIPVGFGIVTTNNIEQAIERAGTKAGNKGFDTAMGVLEMVDLLEQV
ncbi:MAG: 6,7-dimethyl-8-ribityllumazine synthase [Tissierellia bacterium]|nr:6,7-dimethyl-8-ribityllumazine synthase [Tissierellia bacterium]